MNQIKEEIKDCIAFTTTYWKIKEIKERIRLIQGGQGAGKNMAIALILLGRQDAKRITVVSDTYKNLNDGAVEDFRKIITKWGYDFNEMFHKSDMNLFWFSQIIKFRHLDDNKPDKGKGPRRDILYINEANRTEWSAVKHYIARSEEVYIDYNPDYPFWANTELEPYANCKKIIVTYKDNEMCPPQEVEHIEQRKSNKDWYQVYGLGQMGTYSERRIYDFEVIDKIPEDAIRIPSGMDFGVSPDPTVLLNIYYLKNNLYVDEVFIENNLMPEKIKGAERMSIVDKLDEINFPKKQLIIGDRSGATELLNLRKYGYRVLGIGGSVMLGMKRLKSWNIRVTSRSTTTIHAFSNFLWDLDKNGKIVPEPPRRHEFDTIAAVRYVAMAKMHWNN